MFMSWQLHFLNQAVNIGLVLDISAAHMVAIEQWYSELHDVLLLLCRDDDVKFDWSCQLSGSVTEVPQLFLLLPRNKTKACSAA